TGSLPRPPELTRVYAERERGAAIDEAELTRLSRLAMRGVVAKQIEAGIDIGNNGEQQREGFFLHVRRRMSGFGSTWKRNPRADIEHYPIFKRGFEARIAAKEAVGNFAPPKAVGEVRYLSDALVREECEDFRAALATLKTGFADAFLTAPSPGIIAAAMRNDYYDREDAYLHALGRALKTEYDAIIAAGFLLQLDCPDLALERHVSYQDRPLNQFLGFVEKVVGVINDALIDIPRERVRLHACWGNYEAPHDCDVPLAEILPLLAEAKVGALVLPFANPRHAHEIDLMGKMRLPQDQILVAGVIDTLTNFVEHPELVAERLIRAARAMGDPRRVIAGTDCGFDTSAGMGRVAEDVVWAKLKTMSEGARLASERLFG
ncbi:MAG TPA: hypothetical protein VKT70_02320, partial [Stellaceae bacterium]|nr:hypothetical protein [Stellaceae bacterium]